MTTFSCENNVFETFDSVLGYGEAYLESQGIDYETNWDMGKNLFALGVIIVGCLFLAYLQLRCAKRYK